MSESPLLNKMDALLKKPGLFDQPPAPELAALAAVAVTAYTKPAPAASVPATSSSSRWVSAGREDLLR